MARRDLNVTIDGDSRGFTRAAKRAQQSARVYQQEIDRANARMLRFAQIGALIAPPVVTGTAAIAGGMGAAASAAGTLAAAGGTIALAMGGLGDALSALNDAHLDPTETNLQAVEEAMRGLAPAGRDFVRFLDSLRPNLEELQQVAQAGLLPGVEQGIRDVMVLFPQVRDLVGTTAEALGELAADAGQALTAPFWRNYIDFLSTQAAPTLEQFAQVAGNVAEGFAGIQMAFGDLSIDMGRGLVDLSRQFADFGSQLSASEGFSDFVGYVREVTPQILDTVGAIASALGDVAVAAAPIGPAMLQIIEGLANVLSAIASVPGLGSGLLAFAAGMTAVNRTIRVYNMARHSQIVTGIMSMGTNATTARGRLRSLAGLIGRGGLWGTALTVGAGLLTHWLGKQGEARAHVEALTSSLEEQTGAVTENTRRIVAQELEQSGALQTARDYGISLDTVAEAAMGNQTAQRQLNRELNTHKQVVVGAHGSTVTLNGELRNLRDTVLGESSAIAQSRREHGRMTRAQEAMSRSTDRAETQIDQTTRAVERYDRKLANLTTGTLSVDQAAIAYEKSVDALRDSIEENGRVTNINTQAGRRNRQALIDQVQAAGEHIKALDESNVSARKVGKQTDRYRQELIDSATQMGFTREEAQKLITKYTNFPNSVETEAKFRDQQARKRLRRFRQAMNQELDFIRDEGVTVRLDAFGSGPGIATGGLITGPGTSTSDSIPARLSSGEFVQRAAAVEREGPSAMAALNEGRATIVSRFAVGGPVDIDMRTAVTPGWRDRLHGGIRSLFMDQLDALLQGPSNVSGNVAIGKAMAAARGWTGAQWRALFQLWQGESGWRHTADNPISSAYGIPQALTSLHSLPAGYMTDPRVQIRWGLNYIAQSYGSPAAAYSAWLSRSPHWYDRGGMWPSGTVAVNTSGSSEAVLTNEQWRTLRTVAQSVSRPLRTHVSGGDGAASVTYNATFTGPVQRPTDTRRAVMDAFRDMDTLHPVR